MAESHHPLGRVVADLTNKALDSAEAPEGNGLFYFHDPLAVLSAIDPSLMTVASYHVSVETAGQVSRGITIADRRMRKSELKATPNMHVAVDVDPDRALHLLRTRLCPS